MAQVQKLLGDKVGKQIFFYSISIDPERDTPERLKAYAERYHVGPGWQFLTGKPDDIKLVANKLGLASLTDAANRDGHQPSLMVGNEATGQWMRNSAIDNPQFLAATISNFFGWNAGKPVHDYAKLDVAPPVDKGAYLFQTRCAACHTIGKGDSLGPDLANVGKRRDPAWIDRFLRDPGKMIDGGDPIATALFAKYRGVRMPNLSLGDEDIAALLGQIDAKSKPAATASR
jgi:protein SCO1/2